MGIQFRRYCMFCGGTGLTKEHVWADWTAAYIPKNVPRHGTMKAVISDLGSPNPRLANIVKPIAGDPRSRKVRCVCEECNTGWMSRIQNAVKRTAIPLITGRPVTLDRKAQTLLSMWITVAVMASEHSDRDAIGISESDRKWLYNFQCVPPNWRIHIGWYPQGMRDPFWIHESGVILEEVTKVPLPDGEDLNTQASTYCIGQLYVHAFSSVRDDIARNWRPDPVRTAQWLQQISPAIEDRVDWPLGPPMDEAKAYALVGGVLMLANELNARFGTPQHGSEANPNGR